MSNSNRERNSLQAKRGSCGPKHTIVGNPVGDAVCAYEDCMETRLKDEVWLMDLPSLPMLTM